MKRFFSFVALAVVALFGVSTASFAAVDLTDFVISMTPVETLAGIVLAALAVMFGIRKLIKLANRS